MLLEPMRKGQAIREKLVGGCGGAISSEMVG